MHNFEGQCWHCGQNLNSADYGRENRCPRCGKATHVCRNCRLFAPEKSSACMEPQVERIVDKERANFCEWFEPTDRFGNSPAASAEALLKAAEDLFK